MHVNELFTEVARKVAQRTGMIRVPLGITFQRSSDKDYSIVAYSCHSISELTEQLKTPFATEVQIICFGVPIMNVATETPHVESAC